MSAYVTVLRQEKNSS